MSLEVAPASYVSVAPYTVETHYGPKQYASWRSAIAAAKWACSHVTDAKGVVIWACRTNLTGA